MEITTKYAENCLSLKLFTWGKLSVFRIWTYSELLRTILSSLPCHFAIN